MPKVSDEERQRNGGESVVRSTNRERCVVTHCDWQRGSSQATPTTNGC